MAIDYSVIGSRIKQARLAKNMTQEDLADKIVKPAKVITVDNVSPLLDHHNAVYVFMGAGDIQLYERSFEELLASLQTHM